MEQVDAAGNTRRAIGSPGPPTAARRDELPACAPLRRGDERHPMRVIP